MCCKCLSVIYDQEHALLRPRPRASVSLALRALKACCCCCWTGTMEEKHTDESDKDPQSASYQRRMWRNFQEKTKPFLSPKLGSERRRSGDSKKESGLWMFKRKKKQVLDRVFSSSQPNLSSTPPSLVCDSTLCEEPDSSASKGLGISPLAVTDGASISKPEISVSAHGSPKLLVAQLAMSQQKSSSLGSTCFEKLVVESAASSEDELAKNASDLVRLKGINIVEASNEELHLPSKPGMYQLDIVLKKGNNLAIRDRGGTSDPYVKFKIAGKEVFRSKTIHKNLNPVWEEKVSLLVESLREPLYVKVFDYDFGLQDDFMGSAYLHLESLEHQRTLDVTLELKDPHYPNHDLGSLDLTVTLIPKEGDFRETTMLMRRSWKRSSKHQSLRLSDIHRKAQLWRGIVSISLIEAHNLQPMDTNGLSDPYVKFRMGHQKYKSKTIPKTLNPQWREQFDFHLFDEQGGFIDVTVWDKDAGKKDDFMGRCQVDLSLLSKECTHRLDMPLDEGEGTLVLLVTLTASAAVSIADLSVNILDDPRERKEILQRYSLLRSFNNIKDVGMVQVKVIRAEGLMAADVTGKSDPFCVVELSNDRLQTHTVYKNLNPEWNKVFTFNVKDIHSVLEVTVYDEDRDRSADFLGKVAIPLLNIQNGERKAYALKSKELTGPTKGVIFLEIDVIYNIVKAGMRTLIPIEQKYIEEEPRVSKQMLLQNFNRMRRCIMLLINAGCYINSCFEWESPQRSICAFLLFVVVVWNFELYMVPLVLLMLLTWNYVLIASGKDTRQGDVQAVEDLLEDEEEDFDRDDKDSERKGFMNKLYAIQDVCISVQSALDEVASYGERIKNTFNWTVPFLSWLAIVALCAATLVVYYIPIRYIVLAWGVNKFTKKLRDPYSIDNNELLDFLSRVPSDVQVVQYRELKVDPSPSPNKRKKNNLG
ncbi:multiple C2 and transmembrane domain-containing protein 1 isoform X4 [Pimephales promelas]|uniref:multiple C2 and transmembrane domain-containing protein 1 isoform X4 n=1 Tax=Pimephales promelas TaxID=90988 RepID=UPI0019556485|nr:multiple C2 and transmembrane domain-containing protein 1 isoform X4 [Pimephales promelas]KAG1957006.1 multiple C2 and transmembrane domain-containing protein [Pimephales promelas]